MNTDLACVSHSLQVFHADASNSDALDAARRVL